MKTMSPVSTAAASGGVAGAAVVIISWLLTLVHVEVPAEVAASMMVLGAPLLHLVVVRAGLEPVVVAAPVVVAQPVASIPSQPSSATGIAQLAAAQMKVAVQAAQPVTPAV